MKRFFMSLFALPGLLLGCSQGTPGGPGVSASAPSYGQAENTFNLSVPRLATTLQQGEMFEANIGIKRGVNFDQDMAVKDSFTFKLPTVVALPQGSEVTFSVELQREAKSNSDVTITFVEFPSGVTIAVDSAVIKADEAATRIQLTATAAAALGRFDIKVTGTSADGIDVEDVLRLDVQGSN